MNGINQEQILSLLKEKQLTKKKLVQSNLLDTFLLNNPNKTNIVRYVLWTCQQKQLKQEDCVWLQPYMRVASLNEWKSGPYIKAVPFSKKLEVFMKKNNKQNTKQTKSAAKNKKQIEDSESHSEDEYSEGETDYGTEASAFTETEFEDDDEDDDEDEEDEDEEDEDEDEDEDEVPVPKKYRGAKPPKNNKKIRRQEYDDDEYDEDEDEDEDDDKFFDAFGQVKNKQDQVKQTTHKKNDSLKLSKFPEISQDQLRMILKNRELTTNAKKLCEEYTKKIALTNSRTNVLKLSKKFPNELWERLLNNMDVPFNTFLLQSLRYMILEKSASKTTGQIKTETVQSVIDSNTNLGKILKILYEK